MTLPSGNITFLFSDIEGSTAAWERAPLAMPAALARHDELVRSAISANAGYVFATGGDGFGAAFASVDDALRAAVDAQRAIRREPWPDRVPIRVRMAINSGEVTERDGDYFGPPVNRTARMMSTAHGDQVVVSARSAGLVKEVPAGTELVDRGEHPLKDLRRPERIHELVIDGAPGRALRTAVAVSSTLPSFRTSFVGRGDELSMLATTESRLVTLVGPGGAGKSRLAVAHAADTATTYRDGAWFVDLTSATGPDVLPVLLSALQLTPSEGQFGALRGWDALIVVDNCEHVREAATDVIQELLDRCPSVRIIATSREPLRLAGEQLLRIGGIDDGVMLFLERARQADPGFEPTDTEIAAIRELTDHLDGLPLAIELAAARVHLVDVRDLAADVFDRADGRPVRGRPARHRDLNAVVQWSIDLLDEAERTVLGRLALFDGGFTRDAAEAVVGDDGLSVGRVRAALGHLVDLSLVQSERTSNGVRFRMLDTVRAVASGSLIERDDADRTAAAFVDWITDWSQRSRIVRLDEAGWWPDQSEVANQRAGMQFALALGPRAGVELLSRAAWAIAGSGFGEEVRAALAQLRRSEGADDPDVELLLDTAELALVELVGDFARSHELAGKLAEERGDLLHAATGTSILAHHLSATDPARARAVLDRFEQDHGPIPHTTFMRAEVALGEGRFEDAVEAMVAALGIGRLDDLDAERTDTGIMIDLTASLLALDRVDEATVVHDALPEDARSTMPYGPLLGAAIAASTGPHGVLDDLRAAIELEARFAVPLVDLDCVVLGSHVAMRLGRPDLAAEALGATRGQPQRTICMFGMRRQLGALARGSLGDAEFGRLFQRGSGRPAREAFAGLVSGLEESSSRVPPR